MSTDKLTAYSYCPGGTGKRIKFCCRDLLSQLNQLNRLLDGQQFAVALQQLDRLLAEGKERPCLLAIRGAIFRALGKWDELSANAQRFFARHPDNRLAMAEMAATLARQFNTAEALQLLYKALAKVDNVCEGQFIDSIIDVALFLTIEREWAPAIGLLRIVLVLDRTNGFARNAMQKLLSAEEVPLLLKEPFPAPQCPSDAPWKDRFEELRQALAESRWWSQVHRFEELAQQYPDSLSVAGLMVGLWSLMGQGDRCREAAARFAALAQSWEDAAEALAVALLGEKCPLGDPIDVYQVEWVVNDPARFEQAMLDAACVLPVPVRRQLEEDGESPPPKAVFRLLDRPLPRDAEPSLENTPVVLATWRYYGRQTNRPARLLIDEVPAPRLPAVTEALRRIAEGALEGEPALRVVDKDSASLWLFASQRLLRAQMSRQQRTQAVRAHLRRVMLEQWPDQPLGILSGLTPRSAAADPAKHLMIQAAIKVLEASLNTELAPDFDELRAALGIAVAGPVESVPHGHTTVPLIRMHRMVPDRFSDESLSLFFLTAAPKHTMLAINKLATAIVERPGLQNSDVFELALYQMVQLCHDPEQELEYIRKGYAVAAALGHSDGPWHLAELTNAIARRDVRRVSLLAAHLQDEHLDEPGVSDALTAMEAFVQQMIGDSPLPDQQPLSDVPGPPKQAEGLWVPGQSEPRGGKLWTPE